MLPNFLGIGAHKCGTTTLHHLLASHPHIYMPDDRKELCYFSTRYEKGQDWYESFFPEEQGDYRAVGEFSPQYFFKKRATPRIAEMKSVDKLVVSLRDPADRLYSQYWMSVRDRQDECSFEEYIATNSQAKDIGRYATHLKRFLEYFGKEQFLILVFEDAFSDPQLLQNCLGEFLDVNPALFPEKASTIQANKRTIRRFGTAYKIAIRVGYELRRRFDLDSFINGTRDALMNHVFTGKTSQQKRVQEPMNPETRRTIRDLYAPEVDELVRLFDVDVSSWKTFQ